MPPVNTAPVATITPASYAATEQTVLDLKNAGLSVSDADGGNGIETVTLSVGEGSLAVAAGTSGATVSDSGTATVTISGTIAEIDALLNTDGSSTVSYIDNTDTPSASTALTLTIHDNGNTGGGDLSSSATAPINITAVNDAPVATITPASYAGITNTVIDLKNTGMSVGDVDGNGGSETVTLSVTSGTLTVTPGTSGAAVGGSGTNTVTIAGTIAEINALLNTDSDSTVSFTDTTSGAKTLTLAINDNAHSGSTALTAQDTAQISLDLPAVVDLNGAAAGTGVTAAYTEDQAAKVIAPAGTVSDVDSANFNGGSLTVHVNASSANDQLSILTDGTVTLSSTGTVSVGGHAVGTAPGLTTIINVVNGGDLVINFNTADATPAAITTLIEHVAYADTSDDPVASRSITFTVDDGSGFTGSDVATVNVTAVNNPPVATVPQPDDLGFSGNIVYPYQVIEQAPLNLKNTQLSVSDADGNGGIETATLSVTEGTFAVTAGTSGATVSGSGTGSVTINGTIAQINALLNTDGSSTVSYIDNTDNPAVGPTLTLAINDNGNTGSGGALSGSDSVPIVVIPINDPPVATITPASYTATEQIKLNLKNNGLSVSDVDGNSGKEIVTLAVGEGTLAVTAGTSGATVVGSGTGSVTITGSIAQIDALLNTDGSSTVSYIDNTDNPAASTGLTLTIHDNGRSGGGDLSSSDMAAINITAVNDAPVAVIATNPYNFAPGVALNLKNSGMLVSDADGNGGIETATLSVGEGTLTLAAGSSGAVIDSGNGTGTVTFHGTTAQLDALLNTNATSAVSFIDHSVNPAASVHLSLSINDGGHTGAGGPHVGTATSVINDLFGNDPGAFDFNFDKNDNGHADLLLDNSSNGNVSIWESGQPGGAATIAASVPASWHLEGIGDFDGNGRGDLLWENNDGRVAIWNDSVVGRPIASGVSPSWHIAGTGDFDGNGRSDILWQNDDGRVAIWNDGTVGRTVAGPGSMLPADEKVVATGDFNGDGKTDVIWQNASNGAVLAWNAGQPASATTLAASMPASWHVVGVGDFDGNGKSDLLWENDNGTVSIWNNGQVGHTIATGVSSSLHVVGVGDFDGNGKSDIVWHYDDGRVAIWNDATVGHTVAGPGTVVPDWYILA